MPVGFEEKGKIGIIILREFWVFLDENSTNRKISFKLVVCLAFQLVVAVIVISKPKEIKIF